MDRLLPAFLESSFQIILPVTSLFRDLKLQKDFSYQIPIARHLGTAAIINIIAEYKSNTLDNGQSSTFVSYTPTVLYTCSPTKRSAFEVHSFSNQLDCSLISDSVSGTRVSIGFVMVFAIVFALSGRFFVWIRTFMYLHLPLFC